MINRSKVLTIGLGVTALTGLLFSFTDGNGDEKKKKYHVIHQENGELFTYDTILPMSSTYSVENFLEDKGIDSEGAEIIHVPSSAQNHFMFKGDGEEGEHQMMIQKFDHNMVIDSDGGHETIEIKVEIDEDGNKVIQKKVNGKEVEMTEEELENLEMHKGDHGDGIMIFEMDETHGSELHFNTEDGDHEMIEIKVEIDDEGNKVIQKIVNGEVVEMTEEELEEMHEGHSGAHKVIRMEIDGEQDSELIIGSEEGDHESIEINVEIDDEGNKVVQKFVNGEEVEITEQELNDMEKGSFSNQMIFQMDDSDMTDEEKAEMMEKLYKEMESLNFDMDSLHGIMDMNIDLILNNLDELDGDHQVFIKTIEIDGDDMDRTTDESHRMKIMHGGDEDFTIVLVTDDATQAELESTHREMASNDMLIFPNPNHGAFTIQFDQVEKMKTKIEIIDAQGKVVFKDNLGKFSGQYKKEIDLKDKEAGLYIVKVQQGTSLSSHKVIVD